MNSLMEANLILWALSLMSFLPHSLTIENIDCLEIINNHIVDYGVRYTLESKNALSAINDCMVLIKPVTYRIIREQIICQN